MPNINEIAAKYGYQVQQNDAELSGADMKKRKIVNAKNACNYIILELRSDLDRCNKKILNARDLGDIEAAIMDFDNHELMRKLASAFKKATK